MAIYAYIRVSSITQKIDRQLHDINSLGLNIRKIYIDKQSGKDFNRQSYMRMKKRLKEDDLLIVKSIDRLGRNYKMIISEWGEITGKIKVNIKVLDMPILDTSNQPNNLMKNFVSDLVLQILSFVSQNERENIRQRQAEGIKLAKEKGICFGRPKLKLPNNFKNVKTKYLNKELSSSDACKLLSMSKSTFYKYVKKHG